MKRNVTALFLLLGLIASCPALPLAPNTAVILVHGTPLYDEANKVLKAIDYLTLGDIVTLLNRTAAFSENGKDRDFTRVRAPDGKEGWSRTQFMATKATLAMVKADKAAIYAEPRDVKITSRSVAALTLVAVLQDGSTPAFAKIQGYDAVQGALFTDATFVSMDDLTMSGIDVNAGILIDVAAATKDAVVKKNLLTIALRKYSASIFLPRIQAGLGIDASAASAEGEGTDGGGGGGY